MKSYPYSILRYSQDPTSGEAVNVGVLLYSSEQGHATLQLDDSYGHLSELYRGFCKDDFNLMLESLEACNNQFFQTVFTLKPD